MKVYYQGCAVNNPYADWYAAHNVLEVPLITRLWFFAVSDFEMMDAPIRYPTLSAWLATGPPFCPVPLPQHLIACVDIEAPQRQPFRQPSQYTDSDAIVGASKYVAGIGAVRRYHAGPIDLFGVVWAPAMLVPLRASLLRTMASQVESLSHPCWRSGLAKHTNQQANLNAIDQDVNAVFALANEYELKTYAWIHANYQGGDGGIVPTPIQTSWIQALMAWPWDGFIVLNAHRPQGRDLVELALVMTAPAVT